MMTWRLPCRFGLHAWMLQHKRTGRMTIDAGGRDVVVAAVVDTYHCARDGCRATVTRCFVEHDAGERVRYAPERRRQRERLPS